LILSKMSYEGTAVGNGLEVLQALEQAPYDLIFMDVNMPEMDGLEATRRIVERYGNKRPYIVALTANVTQAERDGCQQAGMDDFLPKPVQPEQLQEALIRCAEQKTPMDEEVLDFAAVKLLRQMAQMRGSEAVANLLNLVESSTPPLIEAVEKAQSADEMRKAAHALRGASGNFGARQLEQLSADLEQMAQKGQMEGSAALVTPLRRHYELALEALRRQFGGGS